MRSPEEFLKLQIRHTERAAKALANVDDARLIRMNSLGVMQKCLMAWLVSRRFSLQFDEKRLLSAISTLESNSGVLIDSGNTNFTIYLLACMVTGITPKTEILSACKEQATDINYLIDSSVVPYVYYKLTSPDQLLKQLDSIKDKKRQLAIDSAVKYLNIMGSANLPSGSDIPEIQHLFKKRKSNGFYSESRIYGGGPDNDYVCDIEFAAITLTKGGEACAIPSS